MLVIDRALVRERHLVARSGVPAFTGLANKGLATGMIDHFQLPLGALAQTLRRYSESPGSPGFQSDLAE